ncbi:ABC transporter substrate-binding protein [Desulforhopalus sp. IMCC35007]|uniref:ABC transporter substrate-binding protein n=1 Tax=Desulforhopalus sp. IMCC35007 TaxID=2569543 RepID=UPI0010AE19EC|nr:ABC transporter substrate-binding protein [Desulforhopalus sp. IMCC35007]TKB09871.1 ABC transporter substrate-binding protein [Desulforhopalus sp. IMCC35007]
MKKTIAIILLSLALLVLETPAIFAGDEALRIGFNFPLTGMFELVGNHSKNAAEMVRQEIDAAGGITVGGKKYSVEFLYGDNKSDAAAASSLTVSQVTKEKVLGIIGPLSSRQAIPVAQMAQAFATPMITPWSTSPLTTKDRPFVFRSCFVFTIQGSVITKFAASEFKATKAAVLYDIVSAYPRGMASSFKQDFEAQNGPGSVVAYEEFRTGDKDFSKQLERIADSGAQFIFTPQHFNEVPLIVRQAKKMGITLPIMGSNSWSGGDLIGECGPDCNGLFFTGNYAPGNAKGINAQFVDAYKKAYGEYPDEPAALTWDAVRVMIQAIKDTKGLTGNLLADRKLVRESLVNVKNFEGATGVMTFNESGDPEKCAVVIKIDNEGIFTAHEVVCP